MGRESIELGRVGVVGPERGPRELDDHALHPHAEAERRDAPLSAETRRFHLSFDPAIPESAGHHDAVETHERLDVIRALEMLAVDPLQLHVAPRSPGRVLDRLGDG